MSNPIINAGPNGVSTVTDGSTTITNAAAIDFTSGATVSDLGGGVVGVSISGGGGGSYTYGNGIYFSGTSPTTIGNTGTIIQPVATGTNNGLGVNIQCGPTQHGRDGSDARRCGDSERGALAQAGTSIALHMPPISLSVGNVH